MHGHKPTHIGQCRSSLDLGCPLFLSLSSWSHTAFRSGLRGGQSMTVSVLSAVFLFKYDFTWSLSCWKVNLQLSLMSWALWTRFVRRISLYFAPFSFPSTQWWLSFWKFLPSYTGSLELDLWRCQSFLVHLSYQASSPPDCSVLHCPAPGGAQGPLHQRKVWQWVWGFHPDT